MNNTIRKTAILTVPAIAAVLLLATPNAAQAGHGSAVAAGIFGIATIATAAAIAANTPPPQTTVVYTPAPAPVVQYVDQTPVYVQSTPTVTYVPAPPPPPPRVIFTPPPPPRPYYFHHAPPPPPPHHFHHAPPPPPPHHGGFRGPRR